MRLKIIQQLVNVNIIYSSQPAQIAKLRAKQAKKPDVKLNVARRSVLNYLFLGLVYFLIFGLLFSIYDFVHQPAFFVNMVALFSLMTISQGFMSFYNVFYESKDLQFYRPYAFSDAEVIAGKSISVILTLLMAILPLISYFLILPVQAGGFNPLGILLGLFCAVILLGVLFLATILLAHLITKTLFFKKHTTLVSNIMVGIGSLLSLGAYLYLNLVQTHRVEVSGGADIPILFPPFTAFHQFILHPFDGGAILGLLGWIAVLLVLIGLVRKIVIPQFYDAALAVATNQTVKERVKAIHVGQKDSFRQFVIQYHRRLLSDGTLMVQVLLMMSILPYIFLLSGAAGASKNIGGLSPYLTPQYLVPLTLVAILIGVFNSFGGLTSIGISLERENFEYLRSLPVDFKRYLFMKFWLLYLVQSILPVILLVGVCLYFGVHPLAILAMLLIWVVTTIPICIRDYVKDFQNFSTNWTNITELMTRHRGNAVLQSILLIVFLFVMFLLIIVSFIWTYHSVSTLLAVILYSVILLIGAGISYTIYRKKIRTLYQEIGE